MGSKEGVNPIYISQLGSVGHKLVFNFFYSTELYPLLGVEQAQNEIKWWSKSSKISKNARITQEG